MIVKVQSSYRIRLSDAIRATIDVGGSDCVEYFIDGDKIIVKKYQPKCSLCESVVDVIRFKEHKYVCKTCYERIRVEMREENEQ